MSQRLFGQRWGRLVGMVSAALFRSLPPRRVRTGFAVTAAALPALTALLVGAGASANLPSTLLLFVVVVVFIAVIGGPWPALTAAAGSFVLVNYYLTPPLHTFAIQDSSNAVALVVFVVVAAVVSTVVVILEGRTEQVRQASATAAQAQVAIAGDRTRTALLAAVSHDLRSPLASAKASIDGLLSPQVTFSPEDTQELLATADESIDRLIALVEDLLQMSRLQAGALAVTMEQVAVPAAVHGALHILRVPSGLIETDFDPDAVLVWADEALLERVLGNLLANALRFSPPGEYPLLTGRRRGDRVELSIADRGPGVTADRQDQMFQPFQRLGDTDVSTGIGLGLAIARGLTEAMFGELHPQDTPGGGLTMVLTLPSEQGTRR